MRVDPSEVKARPRFGDQFARAAQQRRTSCEPGRTVLGWNFEIPRPEPEALPLASLLANPPGGAAAEDAASGAPSEPEGDAGSPSRTPEAPQKPVSCGPFAAPFAAEDPMNSLISEARGRPGDDPIFTINAAANARRAQGEPVINASLGALLEDDGGLSVMPTVFEAFQEVPAQQAAAYAPIAGDPPFLEAVRRTPSVAAPCSTTPSRPRRLGDRRAAQRDDELPRAGAVDLHVELLLEPVPDHRRPQPSRRRDVPDVRWDGGVLPERLRGRPRGPAQAAGPCARDPELPVPQPHGVLPR